MRLPRFFKPIVTGILPILAMTSVADAADNTQSRSGKIYYDRDAPVMTPEAQAVVNIFGRMGLENPAMRVELIGHTDRPGSEMDNLELSKERAQEVADYLMAGGISSDRIAVAGRGESEPAILTEDGVAELQNRIVEIRIWLP